MKQKPIIRHCMNCQWHGKGFGVHDCTVRYKDVLFPRLRALFCRFYTKKEVE